MNRCIICNIPVEKTIRYCVVCEQVKRINPEPMNPPR